MKYLIINGDDFGGSRGINRGIIEAHRCGILTSASLLVDSAGSKEAAALSRGMPALSVGLHVDLGAEFRNSETPFRLWLPKRLREQFERFESLTGRAPTHVDSHHNVHRNSRALPYFLEMAKEYGIWLRECSPVRHFPKFYGQWGGATHWEQISAENLARMLATEIGPGVTELSCHPGYVDQEFSTSYTLERAAEVRALTSPLLRSVLLEQEIALVSFHEANAILQTALPMKGVPCP